MPAEVVRILLLICVFAAVVLGVEWLVSTVRTGRAGALAVNQRLALIARYQDRDRAYGRLRRTARTYDHLPRPLAAIVGRYARLVAAAGIRRDPAAILLAMAAVVGGIAIGGPLAAMTLAMRVTVGVLLLFAAIGAAFGIGLPLLLLSRRADKRRKHLIEQFPLALDIFVRSLRAGHPGFAALKILARELEDPLGSEFGMVQDEVNYGLTFRDALQNMADRCRTEDIDMFVVCVSVQGETGGNLAEILSNLSVVIRDRAAMLMKVRALSSEGRMTGLMLTALPVLTLVSMFLFNPGFYLDVAADPAFVPGFLGLVVCFVVGVLWIRRIVDLKV